MTNNYKFVHNFFLDNCAFDPHDPFEQQSTFQIIKWAEESILIPEVSESVLKELKHPNTPTWVRETASQFISSRHITLNSKQTEIENNIKGIIIGKARTETYENDALHIFIADDLGEYFITTDKRLLNKKNEIKKVSTGIKICKPSEFVQIVEEDKKLWEKRIEVRGHNGGSQ